MVIFCCDQHGGYVQFAEPVAEIHFYEGTDIGLIALNRHPPEHCP